MIFRLLRPLVLASASPRRRELLAGLGLACEVLPVSLDERPRRGEPPESLVRRLSGDKTAAAADRRPETHVLGADTVVVLDGEILGKPESPEAARQMLARLNGRSHQVWTGFTVVCRQSGVCVQQAVCTRVRFGCFAEEIRNAYVETGEPLDKAGAYGIQGSGGFLVEALEGSYTNVVGLPLAETIGELLRLGVIGGLVE